MANPDLRASTRYSDSGDHTAGKVEDWVANARAADLTCFIFDGAADPADLRRLAASVSGSSYWVLWLSARLRPRYMAAVRLQKMFSLLDGARRSWYIAIVPWLPLAYDRQFHGATSPLLAVSPGDAFAGRSQAAGAAAAADSIRQWEARAQRYCDFVQFESGTRRPLRGRRAGLSAGRNHR
jgi:hypothetical protein